MFIFQLPITTEDMILFSQMSKKDVRIFMAKKLGFADLDLDEDLRAGACLDYILDILNFVISCGIPWQEAKECLLFSKKFLLILLRLSLPQAVQELATGLVKAHKEGKLGMRTCEKLSRYLSSTIFPNFKLYQHVYTQDRKDDTKKLFLSVETPLPPAPLNEAQSLQEYEYSCRMKSVDEDRERRNNRIFAFQSNLAHKTNFYLDRREKRILEHKLDDNSLDYWKAVDLSNSIIDDEIELIRYQLKIDVKKLVDQAKLALAVKAIPEPHSIFEEDECPARSNKQSKKVVQKAKQVD